LQGLKGFARIKERKSTVGQLDKTRLRFEDNLDGDTNFSPWKKRIALLLEENEIWDIVDKTQVVPTYTTLLAAYNKKNVKAKRMLLDAVKDHIIPHVFGKKNAYEMWEVLTNLYSGWKPKQEDGVEGET
jgi:hypothetical protein